MELVLEVEVDGAAGLHVEQQLQLQAEVDLDADYMAAVVVVVAVVGNRIVAAVAAVAGVDVVSHTVDVRDDQIYLSDAHLSSTIYVQHRVRTVHLHHLVCLSVTISSLLQSMLLLLATMSSSSVLHWMLRNWLAVDS
jgi:hypothetical protein